MRSVMHLLSRPTYSKSKEFAWKNLHSRKNKAKGASENNSRISVASWETTFYGSFMGHLGHNAGPG